MCVFLYSADNQLINRVVSHPSQPISITAHENRTIRYMDNRTGVFMSVVWVRKGVAQCIFVVQLLLIRLVFSPVQVTGVTRLSQTAGPQLGFYSNFC